MRGARWGAGALAVAALSLVVGTLTPVPSGALTSGRGGTAGLPRSERPGYLVYWDQNEEVDFLSMPSGKQGILMPPWDLNGQMCVVPDGSGRWVGGYDPTLPGQHNPGGLLPYKQPPIGEELDGANGAFSGQTLYVPGPFKLPGETIGGDSPPDSTGSFNATSTYTGCVFTRHRDLLATDIATAQGQFPVPSDGRLVEWFAPSYKQSCIIIGPTAGGVGAHHVDGSGGLSQPGMMDLAANGDVLLPEAGVQEVLRIDPASLPSGPDACPGGEYPAAGLKTSVFFKGNGTLMPFPGGVATDPTCGCIAISSFFGDPAIIWVNQEGQPEPGRTPLPGQTLAELGRNPAAYNPFGMAFAPDGTLFFVDIHIACAHNELSQCGTASYGGRVMKVTFDHGRPGTPVVVHGGFDFPTSVTVCVPSKQDCPYPAGRLHAPNSGPAENPSPAKGPPTDKPAIAGFG
ncbi:MAG TPA: hypothetical protein VK277_06850 [Acidimicrobiales bacterium]|nr:hypothetical protein [Acidimicrobiales bacterium]